MQEHLPTDEERKVQMVASTELAMLDTYRRDIDRVRRILLAVGDDQWESPTPCREWDVRALTNHIVGGMFMFGTLAGGGVLTSEASTDLLGDDPVGAFDRAAEVAMSGFGTPGAATRVLQLPIGEVVGETALVVALTDLTVHGWDLAKATGQDPTIPEPYLSIADTASHASVDPDLRRPDGRVPLFDPPVPVGPDASPTDQLVAFLGRRP